MATVGQVDSKGGNDKGYPVLAAMSTHIRKMEELRDVIIKFSHTAPAGRHRVYSDCPMDIDSLRIQLFELIEESRRLSAQLDEQFGFPAGPSSLPAN